MVKPLSLEWSAGLGVMPGAAARFTGLRERFGRSRIGVVRRRDGSMVGEGWLEGVTECS